ncbi:MAG: hypothetical protein ACI8S3_000160 [Alphaproteobacteria bacterium]|jgi:hypothetical protein
MREGEIKALRDGVLKNRATKPVADAAPSPDCNASRSTRAALRRAFFWSLVPTKGISVMAILRFD